MANDQDAAKYIADLVARARKAQAVIEFATQEQVDELVKSFSREIMDVFSFLPDHFTSQDKVADKSTGACILKRNAIETEFTNLAQIVQQGTGNQEITVQLRVMVSQPPGKSGNA